MPTPNEDQIVPAPEAVHPTDFQRTRPAAQRIPTATETVTASSEHRRRRRNNYIVRYTIIHMLGLVGPLIAGVSAWSLGLAVLTYCIGMFGVTAGYHRYFSHRSYKTGPRFALVLAWMAELTAQKGVIWWARNHRHHHRTSDTPADLHSPVQRGFWYAHVGWLFDDEDHPNGKTVSDLEREPALVWLDKHWLVPPVVTGFAYWLVGGWEALFTGFFFAMILLHHGTFTINSLTHVWGSRTYDTFDSSRNNFLLALITFGEGWHNNHHHYMRSTRQGFEWWQLDLTYLGLKLLEKVGLVWDLREPPESVKQSNRLR